MTPQRIGLIALALVPDGSGVQTYIRELLRALVPRVDAELVVAVQVDARDELPPGLTPLLRPSSTGLRRTLSGLRSIGRCELVHGLDVDLPLRPGAATVSTVHDLAVFDVPWAFSRRRVIGERATMTQALRRADTILAPSAFTAERVRARFGRDAVVVPSAASPDMVPSSPREVDEVRTRFDLPEVFVLHVGTVEPRKDVPTLASACAIAGVALVLAGAVPDPARLPRGVRALGYVRRCDLPALYGAATLVAYPSRYEGFGLPPLEAMACGAAVVASRVTSLPEVLGAGAAFAPPADAEALGKLLSDLVADSERRAELAVAGLRRAGEYSWNATADATVRAYRQTAGGFG